MKRGDRASRLVIVASTRERQIRLEDGRPPEDYEQFASGYAVTAHHSHGKTIDSTIIAGDHMTRDLFYVAASRGREELTVVTSDTELFLEFIGISAGWQSASSEADIVGISDTPHRSKLRYE